MINYRYADLVPNAQQQDVFDKIIGAMRKGNYEPQGNTDYDPDDIPDISFNFGIGLKEITDFLNGQNEDEPT
jgi:hypothetical protein